MSHVAHRRRPTIAVSVLVVALFVSLAAGMTALGPVAHVLAAPCGPSPSPTPGPTAGPFESSPPAPQCEVALDPNGADHASETVGAGQTVTTDGAGNQATADDPVETRVGAANAGFVSIDEIPAALMPPAGYAVVGQQVDIVAADAGAPGPYPILIDFFLDPAIWVGLDPAAIRVVHDGLLVSGCDNHSFVASPDPCVVFPSSLFVDDDRWFYVWSNHAGSWLFVVPVAAESASATIPAGGTVTTDAEGDGASPGDPIETSIESPVGGTVSINEGSPGGAPPAGFSFVGQEIILTAPAATVAAPLTVTFIVDGSLLSGQDATTLQVFRDGTAIADCASADGTATPDPCVSQRSTVAGDARLVVLTSHASRWDLAAHVAYPFEGFFQPVDTAPPGSSPVFNKMSAGAAVPVRFALGADQGLAVLASGSPSSRSISCTTAATIDQIETTTNDVASGLRYEGSGRYAYIWKTDKAWSGTCRRLTIRLIDGTAHNADFTFKK